MEVTIHKLELRAASSINYPPSTINKQESVSKLFATKRHKKRKIQTAPTLAFRLFPPLIQHQRCDIVVETHAHQEHKLRRSDISARTHDTTETTANYTNHAKMGQTRISPSGMEAECQSLKALEQWKWKPTAGKPMSENNDRWQMDFTP